jgi:hypothetical protein
VFFPVCGYVDIVNLKLTSACAIAGVMALATPLRAFTGAAATATPSSTSDGIGDNSNPYAIIIDRNVFRLNPPPPPPSAEKKPVDLPKVYLNGIIKIGDDVRVLFSIPPKDAKSQTAYFKLAPGEKDDVLELVRIHPNQQEVDVLVNGTAMTLSVLSNSLASAESKAAGGATAPEPAAVRRGRRAEAAAAEAASGGSSAIIAGGGRNSSPYGGVSVGGGGGGVTTIGGGNSTSFGGGSSGVSVSGGGGNNFGGGASGNTAGSQIANLLSSPQGSTQIANIPTQTPVDPEQQALNMAAYKVLHDDAPPLPPAIQAQIDGVPYNPPTGRRSQ